MTYDDEIRETCVNKSIGKHERISAALQKDKEPVGLLLTEAKIILVSHRIVDFELIINLLTTDYPMD